MSENIYNTSSYKIARGVYLALGGDPNKTFTSVEDIYSDIDGLLDKNTGRITVEALNFTVKENGSHVFNNEDITGYKPVNINVDVPSGLVISRLGYSDEFTERIYDNERTAIGESISFKDRWLPTNTSIDYYTNALYIPALGDTDNVTNINIGAPVKCFGDNTFPSFNTTNKPFQYKTSIQTIGNISFPNIPYIDNWFQGCSELLSIDGFSSENAVKSTTNSLFYNCSSIRRVGDIYLPKVTSMRQMFYGCYKLQHIGNLVFAENMTDMWYAFSYCQSLKELPNINMSKVNIADYMCANCSALETIPLLDCGSLSSCNYMFYWCENLKNIGGFKDLGKGVLRADIDLSFSSKITKESLLNIVNNLYDLKANNYGSIYIKLQWSVLNQLTAEEKAIATNKGWVLTT